MSERKDETVTVTTATSWMVRWGRHGWASITINETTGEVSLHGDHGDYQYRWNVNALGAPTVREFFLSSTADYLTRKFILDLDRSQHLEVDEDATEREFRRFVLKQRRGWDISKETARELWDDIEALIAAIRHQVAVPDSWNSVDCWYEMICERPTYRVQVLKSKTIPRLQRVLRDNPGVPA